VSGLPRRYVLVTGGAGFVGTNLVHRLAAEGRRVVVLDSLARAGVEGNLRRLEQAHGSVVHPFLADMRDADAVRAAAAGAEAVFHLAAQVAVTTSLDDPLDDFAVNLGGTVTLLEALRGRDVPFLFTSTNKVYGSLPDVPLEQVDGRWLPEDPALRDMGISEARPLAFCTPYGCSKGGADQYVLDYAHTFGLPAVVFRMSCIYGPHQQGNEDQGWVAHFLLRALAGEPVTIFGDGCQVRDILFASDLIEALLLAHDGAHVLAGRAFNIGGGPANAISLHDLLDAIETLEGAPAEIRLAEERPGDQRWYVSDTSAFAAATGWAPQVGADTGIEQLHGWLSADRAREETLARPR
jgi:CDP-paratose 2-epimerase